MRENGQMRLRTGRDSAGELIGFTLFLIGWELLLCGMMGIAAVLLAGA